MMPAPRSSYTTTGPARSTSRHLFTFRDGKIARKGSYFKNRLA